MTGSESAVRELARTNGPAEIATIVDGPIERPKWRQPVGVQSTVRGMNSD